MKEFAKASPHEISQAEPQHATPLGGGVKRAFDIAGALLALVLLSPLFLLVAGLVKSADGGSVFFGHRRVGQAGKGFRCLKFRTMLPDGDAVLERHFAANSDALLEWRATRKLQDDPRVTAIGSVLRKLSIDELPQLFNILMGDMSFVGPRPVVEDELAFYGSSMHYYLSTRPGLTGLWQISGRNDVSYDMRVAFDAHYVENWSIIKDVVIIVRTVPVVLSSRGCY